MSGRAALPSACIALARRAGTPHERLHRIQGRESAALARLEAIGRRITHGPDLALDVPAAERGDYRDVVLKQAALLSAEWALVARLFPVSD